MMRLKINISITILCAINILEIMNWLLKTKKEELAPIRLFDDIRYSVLAYLNYKNKVGLNE